mgnify:CR=1 FL=1
MVMLSVHIAAVVVDSNWSLSAVFENQTEIMKIMDLADELPGYVDIILQTALYPEKVCVVSQICTKNKLQSCRPSNTVNCKFIML